MAQIRIKQIKNANFNIFRKMHPKQIEGYPDNMNDVVKIIIDNKWDLQKFTFSGIYLQYIREEKIKLLLDS